MVVTVSLWSISSSGLNSNRLVFVDLCHRHGHLSHVLGVFGLEPGKGSCLEGENREERKELDLFHAHNTVPFQSSAVF